MCTWGCDAGGTCDVPTGVFVGPANSCVTTMQGQLFCWGDNSDGQLGPSVGGTRVTHPTLIPEVASVDRVAIGQGAICARTLDGAVYCAGKNDRGQMGTGAPGSAPGTFHDRVVLGVNLADDVVGLGETFCARVHDTAYCWGANDRHQLAGTTGTTDSGSPMVAMMGDPVSSGVPVSGLVQLTAASQAFCGVFSMGIVKCWGDNTQLQASGIPSATVDRATLYTGLSNVSAVAGGAGQMVALDTTGALFGWGNGLSAMGMTPPAGPPTFHVTAVAAGRLHVCVLGNDTHVYCMGDNAFGQTTGTTGTVPAWNDVGINDVASIASGVNHTCAVGTTGDVWCWGRGDSGQIGNGTMDMVNNAAIPVP
jgi:alpha-tubulin suppressor-like RCC1 family protein